jgi:scyllo-inositol 2-dehydrogenase (NADP+)
MKVIRTAIIGQGRSGRDIHGLYLLTNPAQFKVVAVVDSMPERRARAAEEYKCDVYADYRDLFKRNDLDLIVNASFSHLHYPITLEILKAGFNVLCEKPLCHSVKEVDRLIAAAKKAKKVLAVFQQTLLAGHFLKIREVIDSGVLGRIVQISIAFNGYARRWDWQTMRSYNAGALMNTGPHPLGQALALFGKGVPEARCFMDRANTFGDAEDHVKLILSGKGRPVIDIEISSCCAYPGPTYRVYGTRGGMKATPSEAEWKYFIPEENQKQKLTKEPLRDKQGLPIYPSETLNWHVKKWSAATGGGKTGYSPSDAAVFKMSADFYGMLHKTLTTGAALKVTPEMVRPQMAVIEECQRQNPQFYGKKK